MVRLRKRTQEREVRRMKRTGKLKIHSLAPPGLKQHIRGRDRVLMVSFLVVIAVWFSPWPEVVWFGVGIEVCLLAMMRVREVAFSRGCDYVGIMTMTASIKQMDEVCEAAEEELAPHHPQREAVHAHRAYLIKQREQALREVK